MLSCHRDQLFWEFTELGHGVFTYYLMLALSGDPADVQGLISADDIYRYVYYRTLQYIYITNQQLRPINQQRREKGETQLFSEYPLQTPKRIVEGVAEVIVGEIPTIPESHAPRTALVIEGISNSHQALDFSKVLGSAGAFNLQYLPPSETTTSEDIWRIIQDLLELNIHVNNRKQGTALLYLRVGTGSNRNWSGNISSYQ